MINKDGNIKREITELRLEMGEIKAEVESVKKSLSELQTRLTRAIKAVKTDNK